MLMLTTFRKLPLSSWSTAQRKRSVSRKVVMEVGNWTGDVGLACRTIHRSVSRVNSRLRTAAVWKDMKHQHLCRASTNFEHSFRNFATDFADYYWNTCSSFSTFSSYFVSNLFLSLQSAVLRWAWNKFEKQHSYHFWLFTLTHSTARLEYDEALSFLKWKFLDAM